MKPTIHDIAQAAVDSAYSMLEEHGLTSEAPALARALQQALGARGSLVRAVIVTPDGDAGSLVKSVQEMLEKHLGRPVELTQRADKSLLGGAILEYGDMRIDVSVRGALENARQQLS
jgi:F-type H+-transporting ATPase subunit delta